MLRKFVVSAMLAGAMVAPNVASAVPVTVEIWDVLTYGGLGNNPNPQPTGSFEIDGPDYLDGSGDSVQAAMMSRAADVTITIDSSALAAGFTDTGGLGVSPGNETIGGFFNVGAGDVLGGAAGVLDNYLLGTVARITGTVAVPAPNLAFSVTSDDGYLVNIDGTQVAYEGALQAPVTKVHNTGAVFGNNLAFEMLWFEANIVDAALKVEGLTFTEVPLPASALLLLGGLGALGLRRKKR